MTIRQLVSISALFLISACASYEPASMVAPKLDKASSGEVVKDGHAVFAKALGTTEEQEVYFDADFNEAGIIAIQVLAENRSERPARVRPKDFVLITPDGQSLSPVTSDSVVYSVGEDGSVVGATLAFGLIGWMAANQAEESSRNARLIDYQSKTFSEQVLYQGQSEHGFVFFVPPENTAPFTTAELTVTFVEDESATASAVRVPIANINYFGSESQTTSVAAAGEINTASGTDTAGTQAVALATPDLPPARSKEEIELYWRAHGEDLRRALFEYNRKHGLISSGALYREFKIYSSSILDTGGDQAVVRVSYSSKTKFNPNWHDRQFLMQWIGGSMVFVGHV